ncbi:MAG TPA: alkaline phosphatase family protein [Gemmatimonadota bacterium]|nr:alkaline phosphatase family protein [Gemmatimonadota bacterium]
MRTSRRLSVVATLVACTILACEPQAERSETAQPETGLVVLVTIDQLPTYLFQRYDSLYAGGFRRLLGEGRYYVETVHDHSETWTSVGHATLATGRIPRRHGVVANDWHEHIEDEPEWVGSVDDGSEETLGAPEVLGRSPRNLQVTGLADWILAADSGARVVSISAQRTTSILLAGRAKGHVYYYEEPVGRFVTTSYYRDSYPGWVDRFNATTLQEYYADTVWACEIPAERRALARRDDVDYEGDGVHTTFPHRYYEEVEDHGSREDFYNWWADTPSLDEATLALAREAVTALSLGRRGSVDFLAVGFSQTDRVGHPYGPYSLEQLDNLIRVDRVVGELLDFLDAEVGAGRYVLALTSDHGTSPIAAYLQELGQPGRQLSRDERRALRGSVRDIMSGDGSREELWAAAINRLEIEDYIADAMTVNELAAEQPSDTFVALHARAYYPGRVPQALGRYGLVLRYTAGTNWTGDRATHGSPYLYDRRVPLIFIGPGIEAAHVDEPVRTVDVAPTLAALAGIPYPADLDGRPLPVR